jgi:hypothetical protein
LFSSLNLPLRNIFRPGPLFFVVLHGEKEISGPLKKSRALVINASPHNNQIPSTFQQNLSRDRINNQSRNSDMQAMEKKKRPPLHSQQQGRKTSIIPSASDPQHLFTYPYNFEEHSKSIPWTFVAKGDLRAPETGQRTYSSTPHHSTRYGYPRNDGIFVATA